MSYHHLINRHTGWFLRQVSGVVLSLVFYLLSAVAPTAIHAQQNDNYRSNLRNPNVKVQQTNLPIVFIQVGGKVIKRDTYILAKMKIIHNGDGFSNYADTIAHPGQHIDYEGWIALKYRGNTSFDASDKKPFAFRTLETDLLPDKGGAKKKVKILGMPKDNKWGFIAPWADEVMFRDVLSFELGKPWFDWVPQARMCEVILDGTYYGVYVLCERVSKGKHRLDLDEPGQNDGDLTGDYHVVVDHGNDSYFASRHRPWQSLDGKKIAYTYRIKYEYQDPDDDEFAELPQGAREALQNEINKMEDSFLASDWDDPDGGYRATIDPQSFIDYMLSTEAAMNVDGYRLSTHLYKHAQKRAENEGIDPRWKTTLWDFNIAWGNANYYDGQNTNAWQYELNMKFQGDDCPVPFYWYRMLQDEQFVSDLKQRWQQYRQGNYSDQRLMQTVDSLANLIKSGGAAQRNEQAWSVFTRSYIWPVPYYATDFDDAVNYLKGWIQRRMQFLDKQLLPPRDIDTQPLHIATGFNADIFAEALPANSFTSRTIDAANRTFYAESLKSQGGFPNDRCITSNNDKVEYQIAPYDGYNALSLQNYGQTETLTFSEPVLTDELFILATSGNGESSVTVTLNYADGTSTQAGTFTIRDWSVRNNALQGDEAVTALGNIRRDNNAYSSDNHYCLFDFSIPVQPSPLQSVTFTQRSTAYACILALSQLVNSNSAIASCMPDSHTPNCHPATYSPQGIKVSGSQKGLILIRQNDGTVRKVIRK